MSSTRRPFPSNPHGAKRLTRLLAALAALPVCAMAQGQDTSPYYFGGSLGLTHVSNIYRTPSGTEPTAGSGAANSDTVTTASLLGGVDLRLGREHLRADGSVQSNRYANNTQLNNLGYNGHLSLDWSTLYNISGTVNLGGSRQLSSTVPGYGYTPVYAKNVQTEYSADAVTRIGLVTRWTLEGDVGYDRRTFSAPQYKSLDLSQTYYSLGPVYRPSDALRIGVDLRHTRGSLPFYDYERNPLTNQPFLNPDTGEPYYIPNDFTRNDVDLKVYWKATGSNEFEVRLSQGRSRHATGVGQDFSGFTGQLTWNWTPTGRLSFSTQLIRDTGLQTSFASFLGQSYNSYASDQLTTTLRSYVTYNYSAKLSFNGSVSYARGSLDVTNPVSGAHDTLDNTDYAASLGVSWQYSRGISFNCSVGRQERTGNPLLNPYTANNFGCVGQWIVY